MTQKEPKTLRPAGDFSPIELQRYTIEQLLNVLEEPNLPRSERLNILKELRMCGAGLDEMLKSGNGKPEQRAPERMLRAEKDNNDAEHLDGLSFADYEQPATATT